ncbi:MAG: tyrosine-type recombinase/integrase [Gammaproteobacteria bacterium]|nr:tyrosine-type recombinase/integrase [Gammaproteobacteria bacterium]
MGKLNIAKIRALRRPGRYADGGTLYLVVSRGGTKSFVQRLAIDGRRHDIGLGSWPLTTLAEARVMAFENRRIARKGGDPRQPVSNAPTFREAAEAKHAELLPSWKNAKHAESWLQTLQRHAYPVLADMRVDRIRPTDVLRVLGPIWNERKETARRVRQRIRTVLSWCEAHEYIDRNVAGECIDGALHRQGGGQTHLRSLPYPDLPQFVRDLEAGPGSLVNKLCLLFLILTATRGVEAREALWEEIDLVERMWRIPGDRMKMRKDHDQPLSREAIEVLQRAPTFGNRSGLIFPSVHRPDRPLSNAAFMNLLKRLGYADRATAHGFRATFRTWASECTNAPTRAKKLSTAHKPGDAIEDAYDRSLVLDPRRQLMQHWGCYVMGRPYTAPERLDAYLTGGQPLALAHPPAAGSIAVFSHGRTGSLVNFSDS